MTAKEWLTDLAALTTIQVPKEWLFGGQIAKGFFYPLFTAYEKIEMPIGAVI